LAYSPVLPPSIDIEVDRGNHDSVWQSKSLDPSALATELDDKRLIAHFTSGVKVPFVRIPNLMVWKGMEIPMTIIFTTVLTTPHYFPKPKRQSARP
jgi:hypothetical protein